MNKSVARYAATAALSVLTFVFIWGAETVIELARTTASSTFQFQPGRIALAALLFALSGASTGLIVGLRPGDRPSHSTWMSGHLFLAAVPPFLLVGVSFLFFNGVNVGFSPVRDAPWAFAAETQAIASFAFGLLITLALVRAFSRRSPLDKE